MMNTSPEWGVLDHLGVCNAAAQPLPASLARSAVCIRGRLTVYDNVFFGSELTGRGRLLNEKETIDRTSKLLHELGWTFGRSSRPNG